MRHLDLELEPDARAPAEARATVSRLEGVPQGPMDDLLLLVSELVSNAVRHGASGGDSSICLTATVKDREVIVSVTDGGPGLHVVPRDAGTTLEGFGLRLLNRLADDWGWEAEPRSRVWFRLSLG